MANSSFREAEAVIDEVAFLEAALRESLDKRRQSPSGMHTRSTEDLRYGISQEPQSSNGQARDVATANYGVQLKAWIDLQVDQRLSHMMQGMLDGELNALQQDSSVALDIASRTEVDVEKLKASQTKLLSVVQGISIEVESLSGRVAFLSRRDQSLAIVEELKQGVVATDVRTLDLRVQLDKEIQKLRGEMSALQESQHRFAMHGTPESQRLQDLDARVGCLTETLESRLGGQDLKAEMLALQRRLVSELRAETTAAFRSEAAAVAALDEQLWLTDQRLGQRIDELAHSYRDCATPTVSIATPSSFAATQRSTRQIPDVPAQGSLLLEARRTTDLASRRTIDLADDRLEMNAHIVPTGVLTMENTAHERASLARLPEPPTQAESSADGARLRLGNSSSATATSRRLVLSDQRSTLSELLDKSARLSLPDEDPDAAPRPVGRQRAVTDGTFFCSRPIDVDKE